MLWVCTSLSPNGVQWLSKGVPCEIKSAKWRSEIGALASWVVMWPPKIILGEMSQLRSSFLGAFGGQLWDWTELKTDLGEASEELPVIPIFERPYHGFGWFWPEQRRQKSVLTGYYEGEKGSPRTLSIRGRFLDGSGASGVRPEEPKQGFGGSV